MSGDTGAWPRIDQPTQSNWDGVEHRRDCKCVQEERIQRLEEMHEDVREIKEMLVAWNSVKGFVLTMKLAGTTIQFLAKVALITGALWIAIKTGHWEVK